MDLKQISMNLIKEYQSSFGSYVASPNFENYNYCWLRDGTFIAYSMDCVGEYQSAGLYYEWVNDVIERQGSKLDRLLKNVKEGKILQNTDFLPCRYTLEGEEAQDDWPNFQLDGYGTWLWGLCEHIQKTGCRALLRKYKKSIELTITYLVNFWDYPNSDCWEENEDKVHPSTLACICGGLTAINQFYQWELIESAISSIKGFLKKQAVMDGHFVKYIGTSSVDASLLWLSVPFNVFPVDDPLVAKTIEKIETKILFEGGVRRFPEDTYYGGGEWLLLSGWLGWYYSLAGREDEAQKQLAWIQSQADENGQMAEQSLNNVNDPSYIQHWIDLWGEVAKPLLWSHALYLILQEKIGGNLQTQTV